MRRVLRACRGALAAGWLAAAGTAAEFHHVPPVPPPGLTAARFELWLPAAGPAEPMRAAIAIADYEAGRELYAHPAWRAFATRERFALLRHALEHAHPRFKLARSEAAAAALEAALRTLAGEAGRPELARVPWVLAGLSQGGWQAHALANLRPARTLAVLPYHASTSAHAPEAYTHPGTAEVPVLLVMAGDETFPIELLAFARAGAAGGRPWTYFLEVGVPHHRIGPPDFPLQWLGAVAAQRLAPDGTLRRIDPAAGWRAAYAEAGAEAGRRRVTRAELMPPGDTQVMSGDEAGFWLPDAATARAWRAALVPPEGAPAR